MSVVVCRSWRWKLWESPLADTRSNYRGFLPATGLGHGPSYLSESPPPHVLIEGQLPVYFSKIGGVDFIFKKKKNWLALLEHVVNSCGFPKGRNTSFIVLFLPSHRIRPFSTNSVWRRTGSSIEELWLKQRKVSGIFSERWGRAELHLVTTALLPEHLSLPLPVFSGPQKIISRWDDFPFLPLSITVFLDFNTFLRW